jgi:pimeloyl-ACP methyl ester carboxylesterase
MAPPSKSAILLGVVIGLAAAAIARPAEGKQPPDLAALTPAIRNQIDDLARRSPRPNLHEQSVDFSGYVVAWLISQAVLSPEEEMRAAAENHRRILRQSQTTPTPPEAEQVFAKLLAALPPHLKPEAFQYSLTVLSDQLDAMTVGGGYVYLTQPLVAGLLADRERGPAALAFVLAGELGHIGLKHCRRGYQLESLEDEIRAGRAPKLDDKLLRNEFQTGFVRRGDWLRFLYARDEVYEANLFALHLCRNAGFDQDAALDALRWMIWAPAGELPAQPPRDDAEAHAADAPAADASTTELIDYLSAPPPLAMRLRRLLTERTGPLDEAGFGLFAVDTANGKLTKAGPQAAAAGQPTLIFVHGFAGKEASFHNFFSALAHREAAKTRRTLFFRYPNNGSLSAAGELLAREMARVVATPEQAVFVCHSAGGLAFRYYAERKRGGFERAVFLGAPHGGVGLTQLKFIVDAGTFFGDLKFGLPEAIQRAVREGTRQVTHDLHPDSLFLRYLAYDASLAPRYEIYCGRRFNEAESLGLAAVVNIARELLDRQVVERIKQPRWKERLGARIERLRLPEEVADGDLIVSVRSATLPGVADVTVTRLDHMQLNSDPDLIEQVLDSIFNAAGK